MHISAAWVASHATATVAATTHSTSPSSDRRKPGRFQRENDITCSLSQIHDKTCNLRDITCSRGGGSFLCRNLQPASVVLAKTCRSFDARF
ncbi:hypothetical protein PR003_g17272 [Phytophthora rubi]|uniref:Uncharacterized protein n=1 Tax=Phytophthora rubi TaxID=129364 RepID=A0A6A3KPP5_9STRA|nr:hypothetical protein PR002_g16654 [Phytophthora rubi]KAE9009132.1 hypothetical protein PR001_g16513 [Phytophthora rubi]KAE9322272.1 hypothetical protein PR003_g17272 [Phytophthora rubi]